jgi:hypothetical protein
MASAMRACQQFINPQFKYSQLISPIVGAIKAEITSPLLDNIGCTKLYCRRIANSRTVYCYNSIYNPCFVTVPFGEHFGFANCF